MPVPAVGTALIPGPTEVEAEKNGGVVVAVALRTMPGAKKDPARGDPAEREIGEQRQTAEEKDEEPDLKGGRPECLAEAARVPRHKENRKVAEPMQRHRARDSEKKARA